MIVQQRIYMSLQKKGIFGVKDKSLRRQPVKSTSLLKYYGPPPLKESILTPQIGYKQTKNNQGLKRKKKFVSFIQNRKDEQQNRWSAKIGELNLIKRLSKIQYLEMWSSKKPIYNVCQQKFVSKLHRRLLSLNKI